MSQLHFGKSGLHDLCVTLEGAGVETTEQAWVTSKDLSLPGEEPEEQVPIRPERRAMEVEGHGEEPRNNRLILHP